jgi:hypothetical protein
LRREKEFCGTHCFFLSLQTSEESDILLWFPWLPLSLSSSSLCPFTIFFSYFSSYLYTTQMQQSSIIFFLAFSFSSLPPFFLSFWIIWL